MKNDCEDKNSTHYFMCHMTQEEFWNKNRFEEKTPRYKYNMTRKILEDNPSPKRVVAFGERPGKLNEI